MRDILLNFFSKNKIDCFSALPLSACRIKKRYLLERVGIAEGSAVIMAVPYFTSATTAPERNLSAYAVSRDYHLFFNALFDELIPLLQAAFPSNRFIGFADHSPIDEIHAAATAGLGVIGQNGLLITPKYASYVFLGELITDMALPYQLHEIKSCEECGACRAACPAKNGEPCMSSLTQKKGQLTDAEHARIAANGSAWGCDICQEVCPHTARAIKSGSIFSPIPYFSEQPLCHLTVQALDAMSDAEFHQRAYAWRGRDTIARNLKLTEKGEPLC